MPIRYKVVKTRTRMSAMINGRSRYALQYLKDTIVTALPETLGIMTFKTYRNADEWAWAMERNNYDMWASLYGYNLSIIKVEGIGRGKSPGLIASGVSTETIRQFYEDADDYCESFTPPYNTICYPQVRVLE